MINLNALEDIMPGPKNTLFYALDEAAAFGPDADFDINFVDHIQYGPIKNVVQTEILWSEDGSRCERIQFAWDEWVFSLEVYTYAIDHNCPMCRCDLDVDYWEPISAALDEIIWNLS